MATLVQLRTRARQRADMENSTFISDSELNVYVNGSMQELYDILIQSRGENYYVKDYVINAVPTQKEYSLPADFYKLMGVDLVQGGDTNNITLKDFQWKERNLYNNPGLAFSENYPRYQIRNNKLRFEPLPSGTFIVYYIPKAVELVADSDAFDGVNGWEEYIIVDAAIKMRIKEETPIDELLYQKDALRKRIESMKIGRNSSEAPRVQDVRALKGRSLWR